MNFDFSSAVERLRDTGYPAAPDRVYIRIPDAERWLKAGLKHFAGEEARWNEHNYRPVVEWLNDNKGRGLLLSGGCGLGKSLICMRILPVILSARCGKIVSVHRSSELSQKPDEILSKHIIYIDDVGTENISNIYGNKRIPFSELCDLAEQKGKLLIITTNCDVAHLTEKYGERTVDRLRAITKYVPFSGNSMRK